MQAKDHIDINTVLETKDILQYEKVLSKDSELLNSEKMDFVLDIFLKESLIQDKEGFKNICLEYYDEDVLIDEVFFNILGYLRGALYPDIYPSPQYKGAYEIVREFCIAPNRYTELTHCSVELKSPEALSHSAPANAGAGEASKPDWYKAFQDRMSEITKPEVQLNAKKLIGNLYWYQDGNFNKPDQYTNKLVFEGGLETLITNTKNMDQLIAYLQLIWKYCNNKRAIEMIALLTTYPQYIEQLAKIDEAIFTGFGMSAHDFHTASPLKAKWAEAIQNLQTMFEFLNNHCELSGATMDSLIDTLTHIMANAGFTIQYRMIEAKNFCANLYPFHKMNHQDPKNLQEKMNIYAIRQQHILYHEMQGHYYIADAYKFFPLYAKELAILEFKLAFLGITGETHYELSLRSTNLIAKIANLSIPEAEKTSLASHLKIGIFGSKSAKMFDNAIKNVDSEIKKKAASARPAEDFKSLQDNLNTARAVANIFYAAEDAVPESKRILEDASKPSIDP